MADVTVAAMVVHGMGDDPMDTVHPKLTLDWTDRDSLRVELLLADGGRHVLDVNRSNNDDDRLKAFRFAARMCKNTDLHFERIIFGDCYEIYNLHYSGAL